MDIHVHWVTNRWGYVRASSPEGTMLELALTYLSQVYCALQRRNTIARRIDALPRPDRRSVELVAGLGRQG